MRTPPDDEDLRKALAGVEPLAPPRRKAIARPRPAPLPRQTRRDERAALAESLTGPLSVDDALDSGEELVYARDGVGRDVLRKLRRIAVRGNLLGTPQHGGMQGTHAQRGAQTRDETRRHGFGADW